MSELAHYGTPRRSGRYPWGSGEEPFQTSRDFLGQISYLKRQGHSESEIAKALGLSTGELRTYKTLAKNEKRSDDVAQIIKLKDKGVSNSEISRTLGIPEPTVRYLLKKPENEKAQIIETTAFVLQKEVDGKGYIDVGKGTERYLGVSKEKLDSSLRMLEAEGYVVHNVPTTQVGTGEVTKTLVLCPPGTKWKDVVQNQEMIMPTTSFSPDAGRTWDVVQPPLALSSKRVMVRYGDEGGSDKDGVIEIRRGVSDLDMGNARYAQVRVSVDGTHYLKGMAMYGDDIPNGYDVVFNTNKSSTGNKLDAMKPMKMDDPSNPFGAQIRRQIIKTNPDGTKTVTSALNMVNEEGDWEKWSKNLSSQMLSKQSSALAKQQLGLVYDQKKADLDEIMALSNPVVRKKLLMTYADNADSAAASLKAAKLPRQENAVLLPIKSLKDNEIYAPKFRQGEDVVLIRHPHGGTFEIPELRVNNRNPEAKRLIDRAKDAVGINPKVAARLSGADFDGDTVLVIPNPRTGVNRVKSTPALEGLKGFDPQRMYKLPDSAPRLKDKTKQRMMGDVSNLITDMTIKGAHEQEIARAVRHSMVVIDAEKHHLDYKRSAQDNGIAALKAKYQGRSDAGADTIISLAKSEARITPRKPRPAAEGGPIDKKTGKKVFVTKEGPNTYVDKRGKVVKLTQKVKKMDLVDDAHELSSGRPIETIYANHANRMKTLANTARREAVNTPNAKWDPTAKKTYAREVASLEAKLDLALKNAPRERFAQRVANSTIKVVKEERPDMDSDDLKKLKGRALKEARAKTGAEKANINITDREWQAIQAGAVSSKRLSDIMDHSDLDRVRELATPRSMQGLTSAKVARARSMADLGYTQAEIADAIGVSVSTLSKEL